MKQPVPMPLPGFGTKGDLTDTSLLGHDFGHESGHNSGPREDFPTCMAEALDILVERAMRHGLVEVAHLLEVAALAARDAAPPSIDQPCQAERKSDDASSART